MRSPRLPLLAFLALSFGAAACGGVADEISPTPSSTSPDSSSTSTSTGVADVSGSASFTVMSDRPTEGSSAGASYRRQASLSPKSTCTTTTIGGCTVNPCSTSSSWPSADGEPATVPNAGSVTIGGAEMAPASLAPGGNAGYASETVDGIAWNAGGEPVTLTWQHFPGDPSQPGGTIALASPAYVALMAGSAFAAAPRTVPRDQDLVIAWTPDTTPSTADQVLVDVTAGSTQISCDFSLALGTGVVPSAALEYLTAGAGTYDVHSKEYAYQNLSGADGAQWSMAFNVDAHARTSDGLATGAITIQ
jgi:hypothetical protein